MPPGMMQSIAPLFEISLAPTDAAPTRARAEVSAWLGQGPHDDAILRDAQLLVSELVTNGIRHARISADQPLHLTASLGITTLRLELRDHGTRGTVARRRPQPHDATAGGFGLDLVAQLSSAWGVQRDAHGTTVWLELPMATTG
jgi:anti-sigma regulatory factor (Ser/Thr protein kinase)